jgi:hypothetical protein
MAILCVGCGRTDRKLPPDTVRLDISRPSTRCGLGS